jgi:fibronectin-binding autotransporter adhesin
MKRFTSSAHAALYTCRRGNRTGDRLRLLLLAALLAAVLASATRAHAQTWTGAAGNGNWNTNGNWTGAFPNSPTAAAVFNVVGGQVNISASVQTQSLLFGNGPGFTITSSPGQTLSGVTSITVGVFTGTTQTVNLATMASGSLLFPIGSNLTLANDAGATGVASPTLVIGPNTVIGTRGTNGVIVQGTGTILISGSFADASAPNNQVVGGLTKTGSGTLMLTGNNVNLSGLVSVTGGTLAINANVALGNAANTLSFSSVGGSLLFLNGGVDVSRTVTLGGAGRFISNGADANSISGFISGTDGPLYKDGSGTLTLSNAANNYTTQTQVLNGVLAIPTIANSGAPSPIGSSVAPIFLGTGTTRGTLLLTGTNATYLSNRNVQLGGGLNPYPVGGAIGVQNLGTTLTMSGQLSNGALIKTGAGTLSLTYPTNVYTAGTYVEAGTLNIGIAGAAIPLDSNVTVFPGATLQVGIPESQTIINGGRIGTLTLDGGTLRVPNRTIDYTLNNLVMTAGRLDFTGSSSFLLKFLGFDAGITTNASSMPSTWIGDPGTGIRNDATSYALTIRVNAGTTAAGIDLDAGIRMISNQSAVDFVHKVGPGTMRVTHLANTSKFLVAQGALRVDDVTTNGVGALGSGLLVLDGGRLAYGGTTATLTKPFTLGSYHGGTIDVLSAATTLTVTSPIDFGGFDGSYGRLTKAGPGVLVLNNNSNQYPGGITVSGGRLDVGDDAQLGVANPTVNPAGTLRYTASLSTARTFNLAGGTLEAPAGVTLTLNGAAVNGGFLRGAGTFAVTGGTAISGASTATSTTISQTGSASVANFSNGGAFTVAGGQILTWNGGTNTASGRLTVEGTANVSSLVSVGQITISDGTLNNSDASLVLGGGSRTFVGSPDIPGGAINLGGQTLELNGGLLVNNGTIGGTVNVNFGSLAKGSGLYGVVNVNQGGVYAPGNSPGISTAAAVSFDNTLTTSGAPTLMMELGGAALGTEYDQLNVTGPLSLGGKLQVSLINSFTPQLNNSFDILNWSSRSGTFSSIQLPALGSTLAWSTHRLYMDGILKVVDINLLPGDFNRDQQVTAADIQAMLHALTDLDAYKIEKGLNHDKLVAVGDLNNSGTVTNRDIQSLLNFLAIKGSGGSIQIVPEPSAIASLAIGFAAFLCFRAQARKRGK